MFYSSQLLSRKTALGLCWFASHLESKRLKRAQVFEVSIAQSCDSIINPEAPLALRLSGQLLLGVVRIYQRKLTFLEADAKNAIDGLQRKEGGTQNVDLPDGGTAPEMAITLPDSDAGLLAGGTELFPTFVVAEAPAVTPGVGLAARLAPGTESLTFADDISDVLGSSRWTASEERFDLHGGDDLDRRFSAELERLRSAAAAENPRAAASDLFFDVPMDDSYGGAGMDEIMEPPAEDLFVMPPLDATGGGAGPTPGSIGGGMDAFTPPSLGALPDLGPGLTGPSTAAASPSPGRGGAAWQRRKKRVQVDITADGRDATQIPSEEMKRLMNDRRSLLKRRGAVADEGAAAVAAAAAEPPPQVFDVRAQSEAARESFLYRPACTDALAPELLAVFNRALGVGADGRLASAAAVRRRAKPAAAAEAEAEPATAAAFLVSPEGGMEPSEGGAPSWGDFDDGGPAMSDGDFDAIETSQPLGLGAAPLSEARSGGPAPLELTRVSLGGAASEAEDGDGGGGGGLTADGFTARTKVVLDHLTTRFMAPSPGDKRRRSGDAAGPGVESLALDGLVTGRPRLEACRWFFEALVLRNKGYVDLKQKEPYGEIAILPLERLVEHSRGGGGGGGGGGEEGPAARRQAVTPASGAA